MADGAGVNVAGLQAMAESRSGNLPASYAGLSETDKFSRMFAENPNNSYFQMYGAFPSDPAGQAAWFQRAQAGGAAEQQRQAAADKGLFGSIGPILGIAGLAMGLPAMMDWIGGLGATGAAGTLAAGGAAGAAGEFIPELGMVADAGTATTAMAGGIDASLLGAGAGGMLAGAGEIAAGFGDFASQFGFGLQDLTGTTTAMTEAAGLPTVSSPGFLSNIAGSLASQPWQTAKNIWDIGTGIYGLTQSGKMSKAAQTAMKQADPFGGERGTYQQKLRDLYADPSSITKMPGYQAGIEAVQRGMAPYGYSGNLATALQKYGGQFFSDEAARLASLSGAQFGPSSGEQLVSGTAADLALTGQSLNRIGYGLSRMIG